MAAPLLLLPVIVPVAVALVTNLWMRVPVLDRLLARPAPGPVLRFGVDTFAFRNDSRIHHRGKPDLYANWCFLLARAVVQFQRFARFAPDEPRLPSAEYTALGEVVLCFMPSAYTERHIAACTPLEKSLQRVSWLLTSSFN